MQAVVTCCENLLYTKSRQDEEHELQKLFDGETIYNGHFIDMKY